MAEDGLDFTSSSFNPLKALYTAGVQPPVPNVQIFNNINEYAQSLKLGIAVPKRGNQKSNVEKSDGGLAQRLKNIADNKTRSRNRDPSRLAHLMKVKSKTDGIEEKVAMLEKAKKRPQQKNVLQRMEDRYKEGPLSILYNCIEKKQQLRVWTRRLRGLRGICVGYLIAFDKHMNLAMMDVDEMFAIEEEVEIDPVIAAQRIERKREKKRNWRKKKRKLLKNLNVEQNKEDEMIESTTITGEIPGGENHGNGGQEVQPTFCSDDHVFEFSLRITNVARTDSFDMEGLQSQNSPCVMNLWNNNKDEVNVKDGKSSMSEDQRLNAGEVRKNKDPIKPESLTFEESHFSSKEGNVKDEGELQGSYVGSEDQADKGKMKEEMKEDNSNTLDPMPQRLNDSTCWPSRDEEGTVSDRESRNGSSSSDEEGKLKIWEEGQCGSEDEATTDDIQMLGLQYDLNEKHSLACSGDEEDIWGGSQCSSEGRSDKEMKIGVMKGSGKEDENIMEGGEEGMLRILNNDETTPDMENKEVIENSSKGEDQKGTRSDEEGRLGKWDGSHVHSEEMKTCNVEKKEGIEESLEDQKDTRSDGEGTRSDEEGNRSDEKERLRKWDSSHGDSKDEMVTGEVEKKEVIEESLKEDQKDTRNDEEGTRSDEEGRLRKWDGSHGDNEEEMVINDVEKEQVIEDSLKEDQKDTRSDEEGTRSDEEGRLRKWDGSHSDNEEEMVTGEVEKKEVIEENLEEDQKITRNDEESELTAKDIVKPRTSEIGNEEKEEGELKDIVKPKTSGIGNEEKEELTAKDIIKPRTSEIGNEKGELIAKDIVKPRTSETRNEEREEGELTSKDLLKPKTYKTENEEKGGEVTAKDIVKPRTSETRNEEKEEGEVTSSDEEARVSSCEEGEIISSGEKEVKNVNKVVRPHQKRSTEKASQNTKKGTKNKELKERSQSDSRKRENIEKIGSDAKHERSKRFDKATDENKHGRQRSTSRERNRSEIEDKRKRNVHERIEEKRRQDRPSSRANVDRVGSGNQERSTKETKEIKALSIKRERSSAQNSGQTSQKDYKAKKNSETGKRLGISTHRTGKTSTEEITGEKSTSKLSSSSVRQDKSSIKKGSDLTKKGGGTERASKTKIEDKVKERDGGTCERKKQGDGDIDDGKVRKVESAVKRLSTTTDLIPKRPKTSKSVTKDQRTTDSASSSSKQGKLNDKSKQEMRKSGIANENKEKLAEKVRTAKVVKKDLLQQNVSHGKKEDGKLGKRTKLETMGKESGKRLGTPADNISRTQKASRYATTEEKRTAKYSSLSSTTKEDKSTPNRRSSLKESSKTAVKTLSSKKGQNYCEEGKKITPTEKKPTSSKEDQNYCGEVREIESLHKKPRSSKKDRVDCGKGRKIDSLEKTPASRNDCREGRRVESLERKASFSEKKDSDCRKIKSVEMNPSSSSSKNEQTHCGKGGEIKSLKSKSSKKEEGDCGEARDTKTVKQNDKTSKNQQGRTAATSRRYTETSRVKKSTDNKKDMNEKNAERDKKKTENKKDELNKDENSKGNKGVKKIDKRRSLKRKEREEDECTKNLGNQRKDIDTKVRPSKVRKVEESFEKRQSRIKTKEAKLPGKVVSVRVLKVVRGKALVLKKRHVNQLFIRGDNVIMVAYENVNSVENKL